jgi:hypothetical protein
MPRTSIIYQKRSEGRDYVDLDFSFALNGASDPSATSNRGKGVYSVTHTNVGEWTITFQNDYAALVCAIPGLQLASSDDKFPQVGTFTAGTASARATLVVRVLDNSAGTIAVSDGVTANANNRFHLKATFRKSSTTP